MINVLSLPHFAYTTQGVKTSPQKITIHKAKPAKGQPWPTYDDYDDIHLAWHLRVNMSMSSIKLALVGGSRLSGIQIIKQKIGMQLLDNRYLILIKRQFHLFFKLVFKIFLIDDTIADDVYGNTDKDEHLLGPQGCR